MKQIGVRKQFSIFETSSDEIHGCKLDDRLEGLDDELRELYKKYGLKMVESETRFLPIKKLAIYNCEKCNHLMVNRDKNPIKFDDKDQYGDLDFVILDGGSSEGENLCEECLPLEHRWGHYS